MTQSSLPFAWRLLSSQFFLNSEILLPLETICWQMILRLLDFLWTICKSYFCGTGTIQKELMTSAVVAYSRSWASTGTQSCAVHSCLCNCLQMCRMQMQRNQMLDPKWMMQYVIKHKGCRQMALKAKNSDVIYFETNNFPLLAKNVSSSSFLVILPKFWPPCLTFLGILRFLIGRPVSP